MQVAGGELTPGPTERMDRNGQTCEGHRPPLLHANRDGRRGSVATLSTEAMKTKAPPR
jgi:hypothetical protein